MRSDSSHVEPADVAERADSEKVLEARRAGVLLPESVSADPAFVHIADAGQCTDSHAQISDTDRTAVQSGVPSLHPAPVSDHTSAFFLAELSVMSPRKLIMNII